MHAAIELGGTFFTLALTTDKDILYKEKFDTQDPDTTVQTIYNYFKDHNVQSINIATFGPVQLDKNSQQYGSILKTPKLKWTDYPIGPRLSQLLKSPFHIETDVNACALAEYKLGTNGAKNLAYITVGTGVGVGLIVDGQCVHGILHPEGGHILVPKLKEDQNFAGVCAYHGDCLEGLCTNVSAAQRLGCQIEDLPNISDDNPVWQYIGHYLAILCGNLALLLSLEKIVIGGGVMNRKILYKIINDKLLKHINGYIQIPDNFIVPPSVEDIGIRGAMIINK